MTGGEYGICHRAIVREVGANGVTVEIPTLAPGAPWGPIPSVVADLAESEQVLVAQISTSRDTLVVIGRIPGRAPTIAEIVGLATTITALQAVDTALDGRLDTAETDIDAVEAVNTTQNGRLTTLEAHTHTTLPSLAVTGNETVGGTLGVTGATTLAALGAVSAAMSGAVSAHSAAVFSEQLEAAAHGAWSSKIRAKDTTVHNRSARQPVVHSRAGTALNVVVGSALTLLDTFQWTQRETGNTDFIATVIGGVTGGSDGQTAQSKLRWRLRRVSDSALLAEQDFFFLNTRMVGTTGLVDSTVLLGTPDVLLTQAVAYKYEILGIEDPVAFTFDMTIRDIFWTITECVRVT